jgi:predicted ATPase/DNA-binding SARP family transcriptional activator
VQVDLLGVCGVASGDRVVAGSALGGRRARVVLAAVALSDGAVSADRLAAVVWGEQPPPSWPVALRGVVRSLRKALAPVGGDGQHVIATNPAGYALSVGVTVDVKRATEAAREAARLLAGGEYRAARDLAQTIGHVRGSQLLADEDAPWLAAHRAEVDAAARDALLVEAAAASALHEHGAAVSAARRAVAAYALDEVAHRALIQALDRAGDRAGAVQAYEACRTALAGELGISPSTETVDAYLAALGDEHGSTTARIPRHTTSFVGRDAEMSALVGAIAGPGLVTVTGAGGVGKSRLVAHVAMQLDFSGGRLWVPLASVAQDALVAQTVAMELGLSGGADDAVRALADRLAPLGDTLLVLDGADPVPDGAASLAAALVESCPMLTVVATCRFPLAVAGERVLPIGPLPEPEVDAPPEANPQVQLLRDRVRAGGGAFEVDEVDLTSLRALCQRCAGLPLALELAAAQLTEMSVNDLLAELSVGRDDHVRALARSSYELLDADEAAVFRRFAVLDGRVGLPFVRAVVSGDGIAPVRVVRILRELAVRGLVSVEQSGPSWQYSQDDDLHRLARELLIDEGRERATFDRLAEAVRAMLPDDAREAPAPFAAEVSAVLGCVRSLLGAGTTGAAELDRCLELAFRLHRYWAATSVAEGRYWLTRLLEIPGESMWRRYATYALGYLSYWAGDTDRALQDLSAAVALFADEPDPLLARALIYLAGLLDDLDRPAEALDYVRRAMTAAEPFGTDLYVAAAMGLGSVLSERGDPEAARHAADAVARCHEDGSAEQLAALLPTAAMVCWQVGALDQARAYVSEARPMHVDHRRIARVVLLSASAGLALVDGDLDIAVEQSRTADREGTDLGIERELPLVRAILARALLGRGEVVEAARAALACVQSAAEMTVGFPLATGLETAALVGAACGAETPDLGVLLGTAAHLRAAGDRPPPAGLRPDLDRLAAEVGDGTAVPVGVAVGVARTVLGQIVGSA